MIDGTACSSAKSMPHDNGRAITEAMGDEPTVSRLMIERGCRRLLGAAMGHLLSVGHAAWGSVV